MSQCSAVSVPLFVIAFLTNSTFARAAGQALPLRDQAVVRLTFDDPASLAADTAAAGEFKDDGKAINQPAVIASPFWNQTAGKAIQLDSAKRQIIELPNSVDVSRPDGLTFSLFTVHLADSGDAAFQGLVAKRGSEDGKVKTNYGINLKRQGGVLQVYVNDGRGYRTVQFNLDEALPVRKLVHLTATFQVADAPGADADSDADDMRIQLFLNGKQLTPKAAPGGFIDGKDGWLADVDPAGLVNSLPLTLGSSQTNAEYYHGVIDEFLLFPRALTVEEVDRLFHEVAGDNVEQLMKDDGPAPVTVPEVARLVEPGFTVGQTTQVQLVGKHLLPEPRIFVPSAGVTAEIVGEPRADRLTVRMTISTEARPGFYPLYVETRNGISEPQPIAIDVLPHAAATTATADKPVQLPVALFGSLSGAQELRHYFQGTKGQRFVADLELKRLGGVANPVLELKTAAGTPVTIAWGESRWSGDVRLEHQLPADGLYLIELHDLAYRAAGANSYRLKLGELSLVDLPFPVAGGAGALTFQPIGTGLPESATWTAQIPAQADSDRVPVNLPASSHVVGPWPQMMLSSIPEILEAGQGGDSLQAVDCTFNPSKRAIAINGRLTERGQRDLYVLNVIPGQKLHFLLQSQSLHSPIAGEIEILGLPANNRLAISSDQPPESDATLDFTIPANVQQIQVAIRDLFGRGEPRSVYRLVINSADRASFTLTKSQDAIQLPEDGAAIIELTVNRSGYKGPIELSTTAGDWVSISPARIPAGITGAVLCRIQRQATAPVSPLFRIVGTSVGTDPPLRRYAEPSATDALSNWSGMIAAGQPAASGLRMQLETPPTVIFRGAPQTLRVQVQRNENSPAAGLPVRISSRTTEPVRLKQANNPREGTLPVVEIQVPSMIDEQAATRDATRDATSDVVLNVPLDVAAKDMEIVLKAESLPHAFSERVLATAWSEPFRVTVETAVAPKLDVATTRISSGTDQFIKGNLQRTKGFTAPVTVSLVGLPAGYRMEPAQVDAEAGEFAIKVIAPVVTAEQMVPNVKLRVTTSGSMIAADQDVALQLLPKPADPSSQN